MIFTTTILNKEHFKDLWSACVGMCCSIRYDPSIKCFEAYPIVESDRLRLINLNNLYYGRQKNYSR